LRIEAGEGFSNFIWKHVDHQPILNHLPNMAAAPTQTLQAQALAKALKKEGFTFCGPTITYAFMQAVGMVNDHLLTCPQHPSNR
jgi:DNA-3-methyladenine glycosylase I